LGFRLRAAGFRGAIAIVHGFEHAAGPSDNPDLLNWFEELNERVPEK